MSEVRIYGSSDDLVIVEGDISDEFSPPDPDDGFVVVVSDGTVLQGRYDDEGMWRFAPLTKGSAQYAKVEGDDPDDNYSDVVTLSGDIEWVGVATHLARRRR